MLRVDTRGTIRFINRFGAAFFGFSPEELAGKNLVGTILPRKSRTGRDLAGMLQDVMQNPEEFEINVNENMKRNGERVWIAWTNRAIRDDQGRLTEMLTIGYDITDRKINQDDLSGGSAPWINTFLEGTDIREVVFEEVYTLSLELSREGREGKHIGTTFMIGSAPEVLAKSTQLILNPFEGHPRSARNVTNNEIRETVKELSQIDGAFIISRGWYHRGGRTVHHHRYKPGCDPEGPWYPACIGGRNHPGYTGGGDCALPERGKDLPFQGREDLQDYYREGMNPVALAIKNQDIVFIQSPN